MTSTLTLAPPESRPRARDRRLALGRWAVWPWIGLRSTGFPARLALDLGIPAAAEAADRLEHLEARRSATLETVVENCREILASEELGMLRGPLRKALRKLKKGKLPDPLGHATLDEALTRLRHLDAELDTTRATFEQTFDTQVLAVSQALYSVASSDRFREAIVWQNRHAFQTGLQTYLRKSPAEATRNSQRRQHEELLASYLQRFSLKNDTIGFFGPVGWAKLDTTPDAIRVRPGPGLLAQRNLYLEIWGVDQLATSLGDLRSLRPWLVPFPSPYHHAEGNRLYGWGAVEPTPLDAVDTALLAACDGRRSARELGEWVLAQGIPGLENPDQVRTRLERLEASGRILWKLDLPRGPHPERALRRWVEGIDEPTLRAALEANLGAFETKVAQVAQSAGRADDLDRALEALEEHFRRQTGKASTRSAGKTYAGRTLVFEDCRRDVEVVLGEPIRRALEAPLDLLLTSARWFTFETAKIYRQVFRQIYDELVRKGDSPVVDMSSFLFRIGRRVLGSKDPALLALEDEFQRRWSEVLALEEGVSRCQLDSVTLGPEVRRVFAAPGSGWTLARYHSPDLMLAARDVESIQRGDFELVLGELHLGINTLRSSLFVHQHPEPEELFSAISEDLASPHVELLTPKGWDSFTFGGFAGTLLTKLLELIKGPQMPMFNSRTYPALVSEHALRFVISADAHDLPADRALPVASLVVEDSGEGLQVRTRDGRRRFEAVEFFGFLLSYRVFNSFQILPPRSHTPRITLDRLVIRRETWRFRPDALDFAGAKTEAERFRGARRWARSQGLPRFVFAKVPGEKKPFYVDFASSLLIDFFAKTLRKVPRDQREALSVSVSEMLPDHQHFWLPDPEGERYASELRLIAVDPEEAAV